MRVIAIMLALAVSLNVFGGGSVQATSASTYCMSARESREVTYINRWRAEHGLPALIPVKTLGAAARHHSRDMAAHNYFSHTLYDGTTWSQDITNHGYPTGTYRGENIAAGNSDAWMTFEQWRDSAPHNEVMLSTSYRAIGVGYASNDTTTWHFYWTATFGSVVDGRAYNC